MYKPNYTITDELLGKIAKIESYRTQVDTSYILPEREVELRYRATVESAHSSTSIEGNPLNLKQVEKVLSSGQQLTRHQYAEIEVRNYKKALDFIDRRKQTKTPIVLGDILSIHKIIMNDLLPVGKVGVLRKNAIYITNQNDELEYTGPDAKSMVRELDQLLNWLNQADDVHPVVAAAILHFWFVSIHPFSDGNGRTTRVLTALFLGLNDYDFRGSLVLDSYYSVDKLEYYRSLSLSDNYAGRKSANLNPWLDYFVDGFLSAAKILSLEVSLLSNITIPSEKKRIATDDADLLSYAKQFGSISLAEAGDILVGVSERTIQRKLKKLVDDGYLEMSGSARDTKYLWKQ